MRNMPSYDKSIFTVRFAGDGFDVHGVSIYDLACTLLSVQRMFHKAHLAMDGKLEHGHFPNKKDRHTLALTIGERKRASDAFALVPLLSDPTTQALLYKTTEFVISGLVGYFVGDVLDRIKKEPDPNKQIYIGSIHAEVVNIVNRIEASGGLESIQLGAPLNKQPTFCDLTTKTRDYVRTLADQYYLGKHQIIKGNVYRLYPNSNWVSIRRAGGNKIDVQVKDADFDKIRYHTGKDPLISFAGRPRYPFGVESKSFTEFEADSIQIH